MKKIKKTKLSTKAEAVSVPLQLNQNITIPLSGVIFFSILLAIFALSTSYFYFKSKNSSGPTTASGSSNATFSPKKSDKPTFKFFVMSFCPFGNQAEDIIRPVSDLFGSKVNIEPRYIFNKIDNISTYCKQYHDPTKCADYIKNGYFKTDAECQKTISGNLAKCLDEKQYLKLGNVFYSSLHGRVEANQDVREMCAWNQVSDKKVWWQFVDNVNKNCTAENADTCWEAEGKKANLDTAKITECFNKEAATLIEKEIAETDKYQVSGSPTLLVNETTFPPESAYTQDGKGSLKIGKKVITQDQFRSSNTIKEAICASFNNPPSECNTQLAEAATAGNGNAAAAGSAGCQ